jgi:hypothetical protein
MSSCDKPEREFDSALEGIGFEKDLHRLDYPEIGDRVTRATLAI